MNELTRNVEILCPLCGNNSFRSDYPKTDNLIDAPDNTEFCCTDCGSVYTKEELFEENKETFFTALQEMQLEYVNSLKRAFSR